MYGLGLEAFTLPLTQRQNSHFSRTAWVSRH